MLYSLTAIPYMRIVASNDITWDHDFDQYPSMSGVCIIHKTTHVIYYIIIHYIINVLNVLLVVADHINIMLTLLILLHKWNLDAIR